MNNNFINLEYYNENYSEFFESTVNADVSNLRERFLSNIPPRSYILDLGCGSGRDSKAFIDEGYSVDAVDGSSEMCRLASDYTGLEVRCIDFADLDECEKYDGVWACASLLHVEFDQLRNVLLIINAALKYGGVLYASFKLGEKDEIRNGRSFTDMNDLRFESLKVESLGYHVLAKWKTVDVRKDNNNNWFNILLRKL